MRRPCGADNPPGPAAFLAGSDDREQSRAIARVGPTGCRGCATNPQRERHGCRHRKRGRRRPPGSRPKMARSLSTHRIGTEADGATPPATPRRERNTAPPTQLARTAPAAGPAAGGGRAPARARGGFQEERGDGVRIGPDRAVRCRRPTWDKFGWRERGRKLLTSRKCGCGWWQVACYQLSAVVVLSYFAVAIARSKLHHLGKRVTEELVLDALWSTLGI